LVEVESNSKLPLLIIGYSREAGIERLLNSIEPGEICSIYLTLDGYTTKEVAVAQDGIIKYVSSYCLRNSIPLHTWVRERNLGVAVSIITSIDWFFSHVDSGVIVEDDLLLGRDFFKFVRAGLDFMENYPDVLLVSGDCFVTDLLPKYPGYLTSYPLIWGWGTTSTNWVQIRAGIVSQRKLLSLFTFRGRSNYWKVGAIRVLGGQIDTWDIPFAEFMLSRNKFCLFPSVNLVTNDGNDSFATHTINQEFPLNLPVGSWSTLSVLDYDELSVLSNRVNSNLDKAVFGIRKRHSILGILFLVRKFFMLERPRLKSLEFRLAKVSIPLFK
jgi:hypothetical protein